MENSNKKQISWLVAGLSLCLLFMGALRYSAAHQNALTPLSGYATIGYVLTTVIFTIFLARAGLPLNRFGFGARLNSRHIMYALAAIVFLRVFDFVINPWIEQLLGGARDLQRFSNVEGSTSSLAALLIRSWTLAAFGEEFAYRIVLLRGISYCLGDSRKGQIYALVLQAVMFGLIHAYQGPAGIAGSAISGLTFGAVVLAARWSIWPAALAHGINNTIGIIALYNGE